MAGGVLQSAAPPLGAWLSESGRLRGTAPPDGGRLTVSCPPDRGKSTLPIFASCETDSERNRTQHHAWPSRGGPAPSTSRPTHGGVVAVKPRSQDHVQCLRTR